MSEDKNIPVLAFVEDVAASGGYWLACAADEIFASKASIIGSIGVVSSGFGFDKAIKKIGLIAVFIHLVKIKQFWTHFYLKIKMILKG